MLLKVIVMYLGLVVFTSYAILSPLNLNLNLNLNLHVLPFTLLDSSEVRMPLIVCMRCHYYYL